MSLRGRIFFEPSPYLNLVLKMKHDGEEIDPGKRLPKGSVIDLVVGDGYGRKQRFPAPDLTSLSLEEAKIAIRGASLNLGVIIVKGDTTGQLPVVMKQKPDPYEEVRMGETIDIWIEAQPDTLNRARDIMN